MMSVSNRQFTHPFRVSASALGCVGLSAFISACGTVVPQIHEPWETTDAIDFRLVARIKHSIYCELRTAVQELGNKKGEIRGETVDNIPDDWGVQMTLRLTMDETGTFSPSASYNKLLKPDHIPSAPGGIFGQSFSLPFTARASSQAVRLDTYYSFYAAKGLKSETMPDEASCSEIRDPSKPLDRTGSSLLLGNVGIESWLHGAIYQNYVPPSSKNSVFKDGVYQYDIKFVVTTDGSINPTWKLAPVSTAVGSMPLLSADRIRTHDLLLTFGPAETKNGKTVPGTQANNIHTIGQNEQATSSAFRSALQR